MKIVFIRHGVKAKKGDGKADDVPLSPAGRKMAEAAGDWMLERGLRPQHLIWTKTVRTHETATFALARLGLEPTELGQVVRSIPSQMKFWVPFADGLREQYGEGAVVLLSGHGPTLNFIVKHLGGPAEVTGRHHACVFVLERGDDGWVCGEYLAGVHPSKASSG